MEKNKNFREKSQVNLEEIRMETHGEESYNEF